MTKLKLWPSGHSDDYSVLAVYKTKADADYVAERLREEIDKYVQKKGEFSNGLKLTRSSKAIALDVYEGNGGHEMFESSFKSRKPLSFEDAEYGTHFLTIEVDLPARTLETSVLLMDEKEVEALTWLRKNAMVSVRRSLLVAEIGREGHAYYSKYSNALTFDDEISIDLSKRQNWRLKQGSHKIFW